MFISFFCVPLRIRTEYCKMYKTLEEFDAVVAVCRKLFMRKMEDYGLSWRVLRPKSITDQIYIKAKRIRSIEEKGCALVDEDISSEYTGIINYAVMAQIQLAANFEGTEEDTLSHEGVLLLYDSYVKNAKDLLLNKNHDYDEAWRDMRLSSFADIILMKLMRIKQIEDHNGTTTVSEGLDANYYDVFNYAVFAMIKLNEKNKI